MPTPIRYFAEIAAKYGDVDPDDADAVQDWFMTTLPSLKSEQIDEILEEILRHDGAESTPADEKSYPLGVPLPLLKDSPPAALPLLAVAVDLFLKKFWRRFSPKKRNI